MIDHPHSLLLVDDDLTFRDRLARSFKLRGYEVRVAGDFEAALTLANDESPEFAVVDLKMPGRSGLDLVRALKQIDGATRIVVLTGYGSIATAVEAVSSATPPPGTVPSAMAARVEFRESSRRSL